MEMPYFNVSWENAEEHLLLFVLDGLVEETTIECLTE